MLNMIADLKICPCLLQRLYQSESDIDYWSRQWIIVQLNWREFGWVWTLAVTVVSDSKISFTGTQVEKAGLLAAILLSLIEFTPSGITFNWQRYQGKHPTSSGLVKCQKIYFRNRSISIIAGIRLLFSKIPLGILCINTKTWKKRFLNFPE